MGQIACARTALARTRPRHRRRCRRHHQRPGPCTWCRIFNDAMAKVPHHPHRECTGDTAGAFVCVCVCVPFTADSHATAAHNPIGPGAPYNYEQIFAYVCTQPRRCAAPRTAHFGRVSVDALACVRVCIAATRERETHARALQQQRTLMHRGAPTY